MLGLLADGQGGEHGKRLVERNHYRLAFGTPEISSSADVAYLEKLKAKLGDRIVSEEEAAKSWYKTGSPDIPVVSDVDPKTVLPLSKFSNMVRSMKANNQILLYVKPEDAEFANAIVREVAENERNLQGTLGFDSGAS